MTAQQRLQRLPRDVAIAAGAERAERIGQGTLITANRVCCSLL